MDKTKRLTGKQALDLIKQLQSICDNEVNVRVVVELGDCKVGELVPALRARGFYAHPESSAYADREVVVTGKVEDAHP